MITYDKSMEIFCIIDEFELKKNLLLVADGKKIVIVKPRCRIVKLITILLLFHFGIFRNFKYY